MIARTLALLAMAAASALLTPAPAKADTIKLIGAVQFTEDHPFTQSLRKFEELVKACYTEQPVEFELHLNSELGLEKDYFAYMNQGISVDYAVVSPAHMSTFSKMAPLMDMPFLFRDEDHWRKVLAADALKPIADDILAKADVRIIGYAGGGTRNIFATFPIHNLQEMQDLPIRMQGAPIWTKVFAAIGAAPTVIAYDEIYNAIQTGVIKAGENEAAGVEQMKFYEVGPYLSLTKHAITVRPLAFSNKTFQRLPPKLQDCVTTSGAEAGKYGRDLENGADGKKIQALADKKLLTTVEFTDRPKMLELAEPVLVEYARSLGAEKVLADINAVH
jgi:TRAP-type C4-dicarboxylate transport system substrate-binding protein